MLNVNLRLLVDRDAFLPEIPAHGRFFQVIGRAPGIPALIGRAAAGRRSSAPERRKPRDSGAFVRADEGTPSKPRAIDPYVDLTADDAWAAIERASALCRGLELARKINDPSRQARVSEAIVNLIERDLADEDDSPGVTLVAIRGLAELLARPDSALILDLLDRASTRYRHDPHIAESIGELQLRFLSPEERERTQREQVARWRAEAFKAEGMLRVVWLQRAREVAVAHGLTDLVAGVTRELQEIEPEELDLKTISSEIRLPTDRVQKYIDQVVGDDSLTAALARLGAQPAPGGQPDEIRKEVADEMRRHPTLHLFSHAVAGGPYAATTFEAIDEEATVALHSRNGEP